MPPLVHAGLRDCQIIAIDNLEASFKANKPRALVQMATGSGKTYTAITSVTTYPSQMGLPRRSLRTSKRGLSSFREILAGLNKVA
jgi:type I restriction enzyme R subunit